MALDPVYPGAIKPTTSCKLFSVPMDGSYKDVLYADSVEAYEGLLGSVLAEEIDFSYQRAESYIRYPANCEELLNLGVNYVEFENKDYGGKKFFAYVNRLEYRNPNTTWIHIDIDVFATFINDVSVGFQFVERMTAKSDPLYGNLLPDVNVEDFYVYDWGNPVTFNSGIKSSDYVTVTHFNKPLLLDVPEVVAVDGVFIQGTIGIWQNASSLEAYLLELKNKYPFTDTGNVLESWCVPKFVCRDVEGYTNKDINTYADTFQINKMQGGDTFENLRDSLGYKPNNWIMYASPYVLYCLGNSDGNQANYKPELFRSNVALFTIQGSVLSSETIINPVSYVTEVSSVSPTNIPVSVGNSFSMGSLPRLDLTPGGSLASSIAKVVSVGTSVVGGFLKGGITGGVVGGVLGGINSPIATEKERTRNKYESEEDFRDYFYTRKRTTAAGKGEMSSRAGASIGGSLGALSGSLKALMSEMTSFSTQTNTSVSAGSAVLGKNGYGVYLCEKKIPGELCKKIDDYYSAFGYEYLQVMDMNINNKRSKFNYYKTLECKLSGNIPQNYKGLLEELFNRGIRLWYSLDSFGELSDIVFQENSLH